MYQLHVTETAVAGNIYIGSLLLWSFTILCQVRILFSEDSLQLLLLYLDGVEGHVLSLGTFLE